MSIEHQQLEKNQTIKIRKNAENLEKNTQTSLQQNVQEEKVGIVLPGTQKVGGDPVPDAEEILVPPQQVAALSKAEEKDADKKMEYYRKSRVYFAKTKEYKKATELKERNKKLRENRVPPESEVSSKNLFKRIKKEHSMTDSDKLRLEKKHLMQESVEFDLTMPQLSKGAKKVLKKIRDYSKIHTNISNLNAYWNQGILSGVKILRKKYALAQEKKLAKEIMTLLPAKIAAETDPMSKDILERYWKEFQKTSSGRLEEPKFTANKNGGFDPPLYDDSKTDRKMVVTSKDKIAIAKEKESNPNFKGIILKKEKLDVQDRRGEPLFSHEPCSQDIVQAGFGDCYFLASLGNLAATNPDQIREMMKDEGDTVLVRFYNFTTDEITGERTFSPEYVRVSKKVADSGADDTLWVKVMEKAYAIFSEQHGDAFSNGRDEVHEEVRKTAGWAKDNELDFVSISEGGLTDEAQMHLTGTDFESMTIASTTAMTMNEYSSFSLIVQQAIQDDNNEAKAAAIEKKLQKLQERYTNAFTEFNKRKKNDTSLGEFYKSEAAEFIKKKMNDLYKQLDECEAKNGEIGVRRDKEHLGNGNQAIVVKETLNKMMAAGSTRVKAGEEVTVFKTMTDIANSSLPYLMERIKRSDYHKNGPEYLKESLEAVDTELKKLETSITEDKKNTLTPMGRDAEDETFAEVMGLKKENPASLETARSIFIHYTRSLIRHVLEKFDSAFKQGLGIPFSGDYSNAQMEVYQTIKSAVGEKRSVSAGTRELNQGKSDGHAGEKVEEGIVDGHAYTVLDVKEEKENGTVLYYVKVRNPWGETSLQYKDGGEEGIEMETTKEKTNGVSWIELTHFTNRFADITYQGGGAA